MRSICFVSLRRAVVAMLALPWDASRHTPACAQYPTKPIRVFLPFGPGGIGDITFRLVTNKITQRSGIQFAIDNRPGAGGIQSAMAGKSAAPDGYSLLQVGNSYALSTSLFASLPYDVLKDFAPISTLAQFDVLLAAKSSGEIGTIQRLVEIDRANAGKLNFGTISAGSTQNLSAEMFKALIGSKASIVPYKTSPELVTALPAGRYRCFVRLSRRLRTRDRGKSDQDYRVSRSNAQPADTGYTDGGRKRMAQLCRDVLERYRCARGNAPRDH